MTLKSKEITGSEALAQGALAARVQFVTGYPGSPSTATFEAILRLAETPVRVEWAINEKSAFDAAFGASLAGVRSLVCLKSVGLNVALDSLMVSNLAPGDGGFVLLVGDDPGGWGSQNEEDSRLLVAAAEIPLIEPTSVLSAQEAMSLAFTYSERFKVPVAVRITRALSEDHVDHLPSPAMDLPKEQPRFERQGDRFNVLPIHVVGMHEQLQSTVAEVQNRFEVSALNGQRGQGTLGIIAAGYAFSKLANLVRTDPRPPLRILRLGSLYPLPTKLITDFLGLVEEVLVVEEIAPYVETQVQAIAQRASMTVPILGRSSDHIPGTGELSEPQLAAALAALLPDWPWSPARETSRAMPSRNSLCDDCPYTYTLQALTDVMARNGGRDAFVITGETGCMVRAQLPPWELLDVKYGMGSSIGLASGLARASIPQRIIALSGDSAFLHSGLGELIDAAQAGIDLMVVILDNETTALSGGQPHPGTAHDAQGRPRQPIDLAALVRAAGANPVRVIDAMDSVSMQIALEEGLHSPGLAVVIAERACPLHEG
jgi:indolepyruvate ferredoxin oxidoreductase alpha subunit